MIEFFSRDEIQVETDGGRIQLTVDGCSCSLSRDDARQLQEAIGDAVTERHEYLHTAGEHRADGSYVVSRRSADSSGNEKVFESFRAVERLFERLPAAFTAEDVGCAGITGSRRHMLVRHFAEHPAFDCTIGSRNPLTGEKTGSREESTEVPAD